MRIAITVDTERDLGFLRSTYGIDEALPFLMEAFQKYRLKATFFVSGESVEYLASEGHLARMAAEGHEIASHGLSHADYREWPYERILHEIGRSKRLIEDITGTTVKGYRAPQFLLSEKIVTAIKESGFLYDSSLPDHTGFSAARHLRHVKTDDSLLDTIRGSGLREFQISSVPLLKVPHGLLWINLIGFRTYRRLFPRISGDFMMFYLHPFDLIQDKGRVPLELKRKLVYLYNGDGVYGLMDGLLDYWTSRGVSFVKLEDLL